MHYSGRWLDSLAKALLRIVFFVPPVAVEATSFFTLFLSLLLVSASRRKPIEGAQ